MHEYIACDLEHGYRCAKFIADRYRQQGYRVQSLVDTATRGIVVQIANDKGGFWGGVKKCIGQGKCVTLSINPSEGGVLVEVGNGEWMKKSLAVFVGTFVFAWPLAITGTAGAVQQLMLMKDVRKSATYFLKNAPSPQLAAEEIA